MKRSAYFLIAAAVLLMSLSSVLFLRGREHSVKAAPVSSSISNAGLIAAPGRVEAVSEEIRVSSELSGRLKNVSVEEGDRVRKGQVLAQIENDDYAARVAAAEAALAERQAELERTINGAPPRKRRASRGGLNAAKGSPKNARGEA